MKEPRKEFRIFSPVTFVIAAIVVILIGITYFIARPKSIGSLKKEYYSAPLAQIQMSKISPQDSLYLQGMRAYGQEDWSEAISIFSGIPTSHPYYIRSLYYTAHALAGKREYEKALVVFSDPVLMSSQYAEASEWNKVWMKILLKYPQEEILADLKVIEIKQGHSYQAKAQALAKQLAEEGN
jgi:hypothetical protein